MLNEVSFTYLKGLMFAIDCEEMCIGDTFSWLEDQVLFAITHETIHGVTEKLEGWWVSIELDNIMPCIYISEMKHHGFVWQYLLTSTPHGSSKEIIAVIPQ